MKFNLEVKNTHSIEAYNNNSVQINAIKYYENLIINKDKIILSQHSDIITHIDDAQFLLKYHPNIIIIGNNQHKQCISNDLCIVLNQKNISVEVMSIGAACRTYNILLNEDRNVTLYIIFNI